MNAVKVIKIGGKVIDDDQKLDQFLKQFVSIEGPKILVHGGGTMATKIGQGLGIKANLVDGRRITDSETLKIITMVYGGLVNKKVVAKLQALGQNSVGLSGADLNLIPAKKRNPKPVDFGWVGEVEQVHTSWISTFIDNGVVPVLAPLTHDGNGNMLNTNADTIASSVATALSHDFDAELIFCFEQAGVMNKTHLIAEMNLLLYRHLKGIGVITDGMIPKLDLGFSALKKGVRAVSIRSFEHVQQSKSGTSLIS